MSNIYRADAGRISVAEAKRLILGALPASDEISHMRIYGHVGEDGEEVWDLDSMVGGTNAEANERYMNQDFMEICQKLGFEPHLLWSPGRGGYVGSKVNDDLYMLTHEEFVQVATRYSLTVAIGRVPAPDAGPVEAPLISDGAEANNSRMGWSLKTIQRAPGYRWPLYQVLRAAYIAGQPCPNARDVLHTWETKPHPDVQVMPGGVKYNDGLGKPKEADLKAIQQAIKNLVKWPAGQAPANRQTD